MTLHTFTLSALYDTPGTRRIKTLERVVAAHHPLAHYQPCPWIPGRESGIHQGEAGAAERLDMAERIIRFMDATGLKPSSAWYRVFGSPGYPPGFDHTLIWHCDRRYLVTTEPYRAAKDPTPWLRESGWGWRCLPAWGMWNPPHTVLYLCSPPKPGMDLDAIEPRLPSTPRAS